MVRRLILVCVLFAAASPVWGEQASSPAPEQLLAKDCLAYLRFDGVDAHRKSFDQTAAAQVLNGDLGEFLSYLTDMLRDSLGPVVLKDQVLSGEISPKMHDFRKGFHYAPQAIRFLANQGVVAGIEVGGFFPPQPQLTVVFPNGAKSPHREALFAEFRFFAAAAETPVIEEKIEGRMVYHWDQKKTGEIQLAWWLEGDHVVFTVGAQAPARVIDVALKKRLNITENSHYQSLAGFKSYETIMRGFVELERPLLVLQTIGFVSQPIGKVIRTLGVQNLKSASLQFGFEGRHLRSTLALKVPGARTGIFDMSPQATPLEIDRLPALPPDAGGMVVMQLSAANVYDLGLSIFDIFADPKDKESNPRLLLDEFNQRMGVDLRKDLLDSLGSTVVLYNASSEGPISMGFGTAIKIKDVPKLKAALDSLFRSLPFVLGEDISVKKETYHGVDLYMVRYVQEGFFFVPTYAIHDDWLVIGLFPQTVQGYILRATGKYSTWKPTPLLHEALSAVRKASPKARITAITYSDPRPAVQQLCAVGPLIGGLIDSFSRGSFDVKKIPNAQTITEPLYPNIGILVDDGESIRFERYASLSVPLVDLAGTDMYFVLIGLQILRNLL